MELTEKNKRWAKKRVPKKDRRGIPEAQVFDKRLDERDVEQPPDYSPADGAKVARGAEKRLKDRKVEPADERDTRGFPAYEE
jgi:hypothetical protein